MNLSSMLEWPSVIPEPPRGALGAIVEEARKYRNCGLLGLGGLVTRWVQMHLMPLSKAQPVEHREVPLVITLTTIPSRLAKLKATLNSLLHQSVQPDAIVLALPKTSLRQGRYEIPSFLEENPAVTILSCEKDWGPATKLIPSWLQREGRATRFLLVDDDNVYPHNFVETFLRWSEALPNSALGYRGHVLPSPRAWKATGTVYGTHMKEPHQVDLLTGTWGFLVRDNFFDHSITEYQGYPDGAFYVDDIWFNGHLAKRQVPRVLIPASHPPLPTISAYREALGVEFNADGAYNDQVIEAFSSYWDIR